MKTLLSTALSIIQALAHISKALAAAIASALRHRF
jgi:hypothetical protein